jgi:hypothetical protein
MSRFCEIITVHTYNEQLADYVYSRLAETARRFRAVLAATEER